jgi:hypothetical protein
MDGSRTKDDVAVCRNSGRLDRLGACSTTKDIVCDRIVLQHPPSTEKIAPLMASPFGTIAENIDDVTKVRIDRDRELGLCCEALLKRRQNVLLYGNRGIGKTFLLRLVEKKVQELAPSVYPCVVNIASVGAYSLGNEAAGFPRAVLLQFCSALYGHAEPPVQFRRRCQRTFHKPEPTYNLSAATHPNRFYELRIELVCAARHQNRFRVDGF